MKRFIGRTLRAKLGPDPFRGPGSASAAPIAVAWLIAVLLAASCSFGGSQSTEPPAHGPFVQSIGPSSAIIAWVSGESGSGSVEYGTTARLGEERRDGRVARSHAVTLGGLEPATTYRYRTKGPDGTSEVASFRTAPGDEAAFDFAVIGDGGTGGEEQREVASLLKREGPDLILYTGDVVYEAGAAEDYGPNFFEPYRDLLSRVPVFPSLGNHDVETDNGGPYLSSFHLPTDNPQKTERYYSFDWGGAHFVALDSELYAEDAASNAEEQKAWLEEDLASTDKPWKFVFFHRPPYSSSKHGSDLEIRDDLGPVFERGGVDLVFNGHDHDYERTVPIRGVTYVVTGGGGNDLYEAGRSEWTAFSRSVHHATLVRVQGDRLTLEAKEPDGTVFDRLRLGDDRG